MADLAVLEVRDRVQRELAQELKITLDADGDLVARFDSTAVFVKVFGAGEIDGKSRVLVRLEAPIALQVPPSPELYKWIAINTDNWTFGHLAAIDADDGVVVVMRHTLLGNTLDPVELHKAMAFVAFSANKLDDEFVGMFGGSRLINDD